MDEPRRISDLTTVANLTGEEFLAVDDGSTNGTTQKTTINSLAEVIGENIIMLTNEDLNSLFDAKYLNRFFAAGNANTCANKPEGWTSFGGITVKYGAGSYAQFIWTGSMLKMRGKSGEPSAWKTIA